MNLITVDYIARSYLLDKGYPIHWYIDAINQASNFLKNQNMVSLRLVKPVELTVNSYGAITLPCDYLMWVKVGLPNGQFVRPLEQRDGLNRINNVVDNVKVPHNNSLTSDAYYSVRLLSNFFWYENTDKYGENLGRQFSGVPDGTNTFKVLLERNEIQLDERYSGDTVILEYIASQDNPTAAAKVNPIVLFAAKAYIDWQLKFNNRNVPMQDKQEAERHYWRELRRARSNLFDYSLTDILGLVLGKPPQA